MHGLASLALAHSTGSEWLGYTFGGVTRASSKGQRWLSERILCSKPCVAMKKAELADRFHMGLEFDFGHPSFQKLGQFRLPSLVELEG